MCLFLSNASENIQNLLSAGCGFNLPFLDYAPSSIYIVLLRIQKGYGLLNPPCENAAGEFYGYQKN